MQGQNVTGVRVAIPFGTTSVRYFFGPFHPGDRVDAVEIMLMNTKAVPAVASNDGLGINIRACHVRGPDTEAGFDASGRSLTGSDGVATAGLPNLPVRSSDAYNVWRLPIGFVATDTERFLGVQLVDFDAASYLGSMWLHRGTGGREAVRED
jgi:hypothetical protein